MGSAIHYRPLETGVHLRRDTGGPDGPNSRRERGEDQAGEERDDLFIDEHDDDIEQDESESDEEHLG